MTMTVEQMTASGFLGLFESIVRQKEAAGIKALDRNPTDLLDRAKLYGTQYRNVSWGWASNIWNRSAAGSVVIEREEDLRPTTGSSCSGRSNTSCAGR